MLKATLAVFAALSLLVSVNAAIDGDLVKEFTNYTDISSALFQLYSGMLNNTDNTKSIHYMFTTAINKTAQTPLVIWMNGGPGCSSLEGFFSEVGNYLFVGANANINSELNPHAWGQIANMLYLEAPVNVGFSTGPADYKYDDVNTANDQYDALIKFLGGFGEMVSRDVYLTGESYAGVYIPNLAAKILEKNPTATIPIKLKGIMPGNPVGDFSYLFSNLPAIEFYHQRYLITDEAYIGWKQNCHGPVDKQLNPGCVFYSNLISDLVATINPYNIYAYCYYSASDPAANVSRTVKDYASWHSYGNDSPCTTTFGFWHLLNNDTVKAQLHVPANITWNACSSQVGGAYNKDPEGSMAAYRSLITQGITIWVLSGDVDSVVPYTDTFQWIEKLGLPVTERWRAWGIEDQVGGFTQNYGPLRFVSVRGAGHMIPTDKPAESFLLFKTMLDNGTLPIVPPPSSNDE